MGIPGIDYFWELAQKIRASYEIPWVRSEAQEVENDYSVPPSPKCICQKAFLPRPGPMFSCQDFREGQAQNAIAQAQALQYWMEKVNPPMPDQPHLLARCVQELRQEMKAYMTFTDDAILEGATPNRELPEGWTRACSLVETPLAPIPKELKGYPGRGVGSPSHSTRSQWAGCYRGAYGWTEHSHCGGASWGARPPMQQKVGEKKEVPSSNFPGWMEVIHPTWPVTPVGQTPLTLGKFR